MAKSSKKSLSNQSNSNSRNTSNANSTNEEKMDTTPTLPPQTPQSSIASTQCPSSAATELSSLFECPVCFEYVLPPIFQCQNGHLICQTCKPKLTACPTCRVVINVNIRNLPMEKLAETIYFPCKYNSYGCRENFLYKDKYFHENVCDYKPYFCPCPGSSCRWVGALDAVMSHLTSQHKSITTLEGEDIVFLATDINLNGAVDWVMIQSCYNFNFLLVLEKQDRNGYQQFIAGVQIIGTPKQAENFIYRLELNGQKRRLLWECTPRSILDASTSPLQAVDCLVFDALLAQRFSENGNLGINVTISQSFIRHDRH